MEWVSTLIGAIVIGAIIGPLARLVLPGRQDIGFLATVLLGATGALVGGAVYNLFGGGETSGIDWIRLFVQIASAAAVIAIWISMKGTKSTPAS